MTMSQNRSITLNAIPLNTVPAGYIAAEPLIQAVEIAIALNKPLVVSGEPGTGKTQLAHWVAHQLAAQTKQDPYPFVAKPLIFNTKSGSVAADLFYHYDAVGHFRSKENKKTENFIELKAMGLAIALAHGKNSPAVSRLRELAQFSVHPGSNGRDYENVVTIDDQPKSSVVLIDEIDKAPRDFPNDLLNEMENYEFDIREMGLRVPRPDSKARLVVIMTSNSEKNLPNAFLRRCVFYHIPFPDKETLLKITKSRLRIPLEDGTYDQTLSNAIDQFMNFRNDAINKKPATSEFLDWVNILNSFQLLSNGKLGTFKPEQVNERKQYSASMSALFKSKEDLGRVIDQL